MDIIKFLLQETKMCQVMLKKMFQISEINKKGAWIALLATVIHRSKIMLFINGYNCYKF